MSIVRFRIAQLHWGVQVGCQSATLASRVGIAQDEEIHVIVREFASGEGAIAARGR